MDERERHRRAGEIFLRALEIKDPVERARYLRQACADEPSLISTIESLISHDKSDLEISVDSVPLENGTVVGSYVIRGPLGTGAFGEVYLAERTDGFRKLVALKMLRPGMASREVVARFQREKQVLAAMDHRNVVAIHDAGTAPDGRPYYVTDFILGLPITTFCDVNLLSIEERLALLQQVCDGVLHAHQKGVIHRDLKPRNILVAGSRENPTPKIIDFGIAKVLDPSLATDSVQSLTGGLVGTPSYMSPEQWRGDPAEIDTRSDIYSLGALLYELLTGTVPFAMETPSFERIRKAVLETDPQLPSVRVAKLDSEGATEVAEKRSLDDPKALERRVRGDLDSIVVKCLEKRPGHRYATVAGLLSDLHHHLHDEPVSARPAGFVYQARKFVRRNRPALGVAGLVLAALVFAGLWYGAQKGNWRTKAAELVQEAQMLSFRYPEQAMERLEKARDLAADLPGLGADIAYVNVRLNRREEAAREVERVLADDPKDGPAIAIRAGLLRAEKRIAEADAAEAQARARLAPDQLHYLALGLDDHERAITLLDQAADVDPGNAQARWQRAERYYALGKSDLAIPDAQAVVDITHGSALAWNLLGACRLDLGRRNHDEAAIRASIGDFDRALRKESGSLVRVIYTNRAMAYRDLKDYDNALRDVSRYLELDPKDLQVWKQKAGILLEANRGDDAITCYGEAIAANPEEASLYQLRGERYLKIHKQRDAIADFDRGLELTPPADRGTLLDFRSQSYRHLGEYDKSRADSEAALALQPDWARGESNLAWTLLLQGHIKEAHEHMSKAKELEPIGTYLAAHAFTSSLLGDDAGATAGYEAACRVSGYELACLWGWEIEHRRGQMASADRMLRLGETQAGAARSAFVGTLVRFIRAPASQRGSAESAIRAAVSKDSQALEAFYVLGCVAAAEGRTEEAFQIFQKCAGYALPTWLDRDLAVARLQLRRT